MKIKMLIMIIFAILTGIILLFLNAGAKNSDTLKLDTNKKALVVYFSRIGEMHGLGLIKEGNTAIVAKMIAEKTGADLFEIKVKDDKYPNHYAELTKLARKELNENARPELLSDVKNFENYDIVFIGYPIWFGDMPMPVYKFIESHDFKGKTIVTFCTHEGSGMSGTHDKIAKITNANVIKGVAIFGHVAQKQREKAKDSIMKWLEELGY